MSEWSAPAPGAVDAVTATAAAAGTREAAPGAEPAATARAEASDAPRATAKPEPGGSAYAGLATRALAFAVDALVINGVALLVGVVVGLCLSIFDVPSGADKILVAVGAALALVWAVSYFVVFWAANGQTPGNRLLEIRVQDARTGRPPRHRRALLRVILLELSALLLFIPTLLVLVDARRRAPHDRLARTVVVYAPDVEQRTARRRSGQSSVVR